MLKLMIVGRRRGGMTRAQLHAYMVEVHGAMVVRHIAASPELTPRRYVQNHVLDGSFRVPHDTADPFTVSRDFITQVWFDNPSQAAAAVNAPLYLNELQPDEDNFVDQTSVVKLPVMPQPLQTSVDPAGTSKLFVLHRRASDVTFDALAAATLAAWEPLLANACWRIGSFVRNVVLSDPAGRVDIVDEVWLPDDEAARHLGQQWQSIAGQPGVAERLAPGSTVVMQAREIVLHDGSN